MCEGRDLECPGPFSSFREACAAHLSLWANLGLPRSIHPIAEKESSRKLISSPPNSYALGSELSAVRASIGIVLNTICSGGE